MSKKVNVLTDGDAKRLAKLANKVQSTISSILAPKETKPRASKPKTKKEKVTSESAAA